MGTVIRVTMPTPRPRARRPRAALAFAALTAAFAGIVVGLFSGATPAYAVDNSIIATNPGAGTTIETSPSAISVTFANPVGPGPVLTLTCGDPGQVVTTAPAVLLADGVSVQLTVSTPINKGVCTVSWQVADTALQPAGNGSFQFTIANDPVATTTVPGASTSLDPTASTVPLPTVPTAPGGVAVTVDGEGVSQGPMSLFRLLSDLLVAILFGSIVLITLYWREGIEYVLTVRFLRTIWMAGLGATYFYVGSLGAVTENKGIGAALTPGSWGSLFDTTPGLAAIARMLLLVGAGWAILRPERIVDPNSTLLAIAGPGVAVLTMAFSRPDAGILVIGLGLIHAIAVSVWFGSLVLVARVVVAGPGEGDLADAVRGFAKLSPPVIGAAVISGVLQGLVLTGGDLTSGHGLVTVAKTLVVALMVVVAMASRTFVKMRFDRVDDLEAPMADRLRRVLGIEAIIGVLAMVFSSWLVTLAAPGLAADAGPALALGPDHRFINPSMAVEVSVRFTERVGQNDVRIEVLQPSTGLTGLAVDFKPPAEAQYTTPGMTLDPVPLTGAGAAVLDPDDGFTLNASGNWTIVVRVGPNVVAQQDVYVASAADLTATTTTVAP